MRVYTILSVVGARSCVFTSIMRTVDERMAKPRHEPYIVAALPLT